MGGVTEGDVPYEGLLPFIEGKVEGSRISGGKKGICRSEVSMTTSMEGSVARLRRRSLLATTRAVLVASLLGRGLEGFSVVVKNVLAIVGKAIKTSLKETRKNQVKNGIVLWGRTRRKYIRGCAWQCSLLWGKRRYQWGTSHSRLR